MDDQAFLRAICENPNDDAPRLVYADWLEERGRAERAEYIRIQIELAGVPSTKQNQALRDRERALYQAHGIEWYAELPKLPGIDWRWFDRGFVACVKAYWEDLRQNAEVVFGAAPICHWFALFPFATLDSLRDWSLLARLSHLSVPFQEMWGATLAAELANCPHLVQLRSLAINRSGIGDRGLARLVESPHLQNLTELVLSENSISVRGIEALAASSNMRQVTSLVLSHNPIRDEGARALVASRHLGSIQSLHLNSNRISTDGKRRLRDRFGRGVCKFQ